ncbi:MAG: undecaprenyldiphospho-muramoylpentapeptide beta-N-acetylglucosaminyltransferase [Gammaproteobacteria bacterium WSBS_2016_MAG_OTU1]
MSGLVLIAAGGTGGHVFPALAIAEELQKQGGEVCWLAVGGMEVQLVSSRGFAMHVVPFAGGGRLGKILRLPLAVWRAWRLLRQLRPVAVLAMGGYAAVPGGIAAKLAGVPLIVHEQNAIAGRANLLLHKFAKQTLTGFPNALTDAVHVGNPARAEFHDIPPPHLRMAKEENAPPRRIVVLGGSQGAKALNQQVPAALALLPAQFAVFHQCGRGHVETTRQLYQQAEREVELCDFADNIAEKMATADLVICRAGAATLAELSAAGTAALLVPYPFAAADHQAGNARFYVDSGAAFLCMQNNLTARWLADFLTALTRPQLLAMANRMRELARPQAAADAAARVLEVQYAT